MDSQPDIVELAALWATLVDDATAPEERYDLLEQRPDMYSDIARELLGRGSVMSLMTKP